MATTTIDKRHDTVAAIVLTRAVWAPRGWRIHLKGALAPAETIKSRIAVICPTKSKSIANRQGNAQECNNNNNNNNISDTKLECAKRNVQLCYSHSANRQSRAPLPTWIGTLCSTTTATRQNHCCYCFARWTAGHGTAAISDAAPAPAPNSKPPASPSAARQPRCGPDHEMRARLEKSTGARGIHTEDVSFNTNVPAAHRSPVPPGSALSIRTRA